MTPESHLKGMVHFSLLKAELLELSGVGFYNFLHCTSCKHKTPSCPCIKPQWCTITRASSENRQL